MRLKLVERLKILYRYYSIAVGDSLERQANMPVSWFKSNYWLRLATSKVSSRSGTWEFYYESTEVLAVVGAYSETVLPYEGDDLYKKW